MTLQYQFADLEALSSVILKANGEVDRLKGDIRSSAGTLQADWSGSASESWGTVQAKWDNACDALLTALQHLSQTVTANSSAMAATEASNTKLFQA